MTVREDAQRYIDRGWQVTTLHPNSKRCIDDDWLTRVYKAEDFQPNFNIGIKSTGGIVDIDCDCAEAVALAEAFLPRTKAVYGRMSRPRSHWLFRCPDIKEPLAFKDLIVKKNIVEVRVNHQSMAPPSRHPEGELVEWDGDDITEMQADKPLLIRCVQLMSTAAMMARYYNPPGARHDWGNALAGFLRRLKVTQHEAERLFATAGKLANDGDIKDRTDAVRSTYKVSEDTPTTGGNKLEELIGENGPLFVKSIYRIWGGEAAGISQSRLEDLNKHHAVLFDQGGNFVVLTETTEDGRFQLRYSDPQTMAHLYPQQVQVGVTPSGKPIHKKLGTAWLEHPKRRSYRGIELAPNGKCNEGYYNLWQGFSVEPKQGDWSLFRQHIGLLADGREELVQYILTWMAETVQHPERPIGIALAFKGGQGVGKSTFAKWFGELFGPHFLHLDSEHRLLGQFNAHLQNCLVVLADEAVWAGGKQGLGALKRMITETTLAIERKGVDTINVKNMLHMIVASNEDWFVPTGFDNRRFAIFKVSDARQNQHRFFGAVAEQLFQKGGLSALLYDLQQMNVDASFLRNIPDTDELAEQKRHSMSPAAAWWFEQLESGEPWQLATALEPDGEGRIRYEIDPKPLYESYVRATQRGSPRMNPGYMKAVSQFLKTVLPTGPGGFRTRLRRGDSVFWILPTLEESRAEFDKKMKVNNHWPVDPNELPRLRDDIPF